MKQWITIDQWQEAHPDVQQFITVWKTRKYPNNHDLPSIGMLLELLIATTYNLHEDDSDGRFFNKLLTNTESLVGWDGGELIDILWFEIQEAIKKRIASGGTFNDPNIAS